MVISSIGCKIYGPEPNLKSTGSFSAVYTQLDETVRCGPNFVKAHEDPKYVTQPF